MDDDGGKVVLATVVEVEEDMNAPAATPLRRILGTVVNSNDKIFLLQLYIKKNERL